MLCVCTYVYMCVYVHIFAVEHVWGSDNNLQGVVFFQYVNPRDQIQVIKYFYPPSPPDILVFTFYFPDFAFPVSLSECMKRNDPMRLFLEKLVFDK